MSPILTEAYGKLLFKCPIMSCTRFYRGFGNTEQRDKHLGQHERAHKCTHEGCDYRELGFPTEIELRRHVELCHNALPKEPTFPNVQRVNLSKALNDAIDRDDVQAVRDVCSEVLVCPLRQTGFVLRAMKRRSISTALVLVELLGTDVEMNHVDSRRRTVLHEAVQIRNDALFDRILDTEIDVEVLDRDGLTPFLRALQQGYFHAVMLLMNRGAVNRMPWDILEAHRYIAYGIYEKGMKDAAACGVNDILEHLFSNFVKIMKSYPKGNIQRIISQGLTRIIGKAASNGHESTVRLILEVAHALDLESMYRGLLKKELHHGIEAMTTFLMQRYEAAKPEIGKNGKTYGNALANAALKDDSTVVMRLLKEGANIDYADSGLAYNALGAASSRGNLSMVSLLVEQGADINAKGGLSGNAVYLACRGKHMAVVDFLLEKGADVNARLMNNQTPLLRACSYWANSLDAVQLLIEKAADVNLLNRSGETALFEPSRCGFKEILEILVQAGADINLQNQNGKTALFDASGMGHEEIVEILLLGGANVNLQDKDGETALFGASRQGRKEIVEILVQGGADINLQNRNGKTALFDASGMGHEEIVEILLLGGANVNLQDTDGETALFEASRRGCKEIVEILVQGGANVNLQDKHGQTALLVAFKQGKREVTQVLIKAELDLGIKGSYGQTALLQAAERGWEDIFQILIEKGAVIDSLDADQQKALVEASRQGHMEIVKMLMQGGADFNLQNKTGEAALLAAFEQGQRGVVQVLIKAEVNTELKDSYQQTLLMQAAERGWEDIVQKLIEKGADVDSVDASQETALLKASKLRHTEVVSILVASGAKGLEAALELSISSIHEPAHDLQLLLLGAELDVGTHSAVYDNALSYACSFGFVEAVKLLLKEGARFRVPVATYHKALGIIGSRSYIPSHKYEAIAKLLRERRAMTVLPD